MSDQPPSRRPRDQCAPALALLGAIAATPALAGQLPVPCAGAACGAAGPTTWLTGGQATLARGQGSLTINQTSLSATLNWQSFNVSADGKVTFLQPSKNAVAINRIFDSTASQIFGSLNANGTVYLLNPNGFLFGAGSVVNVGGLLASSLDLSPAALAKGIAGALAAQAPALQPYAGQTVNTGSITVASGATINADQGQVLLFAPTVTNSGTISTPNGQSILGAGQTVYLEASGDSNLRGLLIEVGGCGTGAPANCGTVTNTGPAEGGLGTILANTGNVTLAGLAVRQDGRISATTSVRSNGSIRLQARGTDGAGVNIGKLAALPDLSGTLTLGPGSSTSVSLEGSSSDRTVDVNAQPKSQVELFGGQIDILGNASIQAPSGSVALSASTQWQLPLTQSATPTDNSRIYLAPTSSIDVSGATVSLPVSDNSLAVQLRGTQLEDFPQNRSGPLRGQTVYVDIRQHGVRNDGSAWVGTPIADLAGDVSAIQRDVFERNLTGGNIELDAAGSVIVSPGAKLDLSGGRIDWQAGYVKSSVLVDPNGRLTPIAKGNPTITYLGTLDTIAQGDPHWGSVANLTQPGQDPRGTYQAGYVEGKDAGSLTIVSPAFVLDGALAAHTVIGPLQRTPTTNFTVNPYYPGQIYRFADEVPLGGTLTLGSAGMISPQLGLPLVDSPTATPRGVLDSLTFTSGSVLPALKGSSGGGFDPMLDPLPSGFTSAISPGLLGPGGIEQLNVYAERGITVPAGVTLAPGSGGAITLVGGSIDFAGRLVAPGGALTAVALPTVLEGGTIAGCSAATCPATSLTVASSAVIDLRGNWVNDPLAPDPNQLAPLFINGGSATLRAFGGGTFDLQPGFSIDVSGGAQRTITRGLVYGKGGSITLAGLGPVGGDENPQSISVPSNLAREVAAFALLDGGALSLTLPNLCVSAAGCADATAYRLDPAVLGSSGFASVALASAVPFGGSGGLTIAGGQQLTLQQTNLQFLPGALFDASARTLAPITGKGVLPDYLRHPESLTLSADAAQQFDPAHLQFADLTIGAGATFTLDPGATASLATNSRLFFDGSIFDPAGTVNLGIRNDILTGANQEVIADQGVWLGSGALIDVTGTVQSIPNTAGLLLGRVLPGGTVNVSAGRGYLLGLPGSQIRAGGAAGMLDLRPYGGAASTRTWIASAGGSITLSASEGIQYDGALLAPAGGVGVPGGSLALVLNGDAARQQNPGGFLGSPNAARVIEVSPLDVPVVVGEGASVPDFLNGRGRISSAQITAGGFANIALTANDLVVNNPNPLAGAATNETLAPGAIEFASGVKLSPAESLVLDSGEIRAAPGAAVQLASSYVRLGSTDTLSQQTDPIAQAGTATLGVKANLIDLEGTLTLNGFASTRLDSSGDIRTIGVQLATASSSTAGINGFLGSLATPGPLTLSAQQLYPTTLTSYTIALSATDPAQSVLTVQGAPGQPGAVLSAAGSLTLAASRIDDSGVIRAPIGTINLQGQTVNLQAGSVLSVSAAGETVPFGQTQGGFDWVYALRQNPSIYTIYGTGKADTALPSKQITVSADNFQFNAGARIDTSGGGDLSAYEWIPGLGGTRDVLSPAQSPGLYAVLPGLNLPFAALDPNEDRGFTTAVGSSIYLAGGGGLAAGTYALLPARYALLPGAYLVKAATGYPDLTPGQSIAQNDGSTIVSGYRVNAVTGLRDAVPSGFDVVSGAYALNGSQSKYTLAQYNLSSANTFFASQAQANAVATPRLPLDAGALSLSVSSAAQLAGTLATGAPAGGRGATVDITANDLFVTSKPADAPAGAVALAVDQLNALGAQSLLLGATRSSLAGYTQLNLDETGSGNVVELDAGAALKAPEVILAASQAVRLDAGATLTSAGPPTVGEPDLLAPTGTALLRVSTGAQVALNPVSAVTQLGPPSTGMVGSVTVAAGAQLAAAGSLSVDAGGPVDFSGGVAASGASVRLGAPVLALGSPGGAAGFSGFAIGPQLLAGLKNSDLTLEGTSAVQVFGPVALDLAAFTVDAPGLNAATPDGNLSVSAARVALGSTSSSGYAPPASGTATLDLNAGHATLTGGAFALGGFASSTLNTSSDLTWTADGVLGTAGDLRLSTPILQSAAGKSFQFIAGGNLVTAGGASAGSPTAASGPGGGLTLSGNDVTIGGKVVLPGGRLVADAGGALTVGSGAVLDLSGFSRSFAGETRAAPGGTIELSAAAGDISVGTGSTLDVSAGGGSAAGGTLALFAPQGRVTLAGTVRGSGGAGARGGRLQVESQQLDFGALTSLAGVGGFTGAVLVHERGTGDFVLDAGLLGAGDVELTADQGSIRVGSGAGIDARTSLGGRIVLAGQSIDIAGTLLAGSMDRPDRGGQIELLSTGALTLDAGSAISVGGRDGALTGTLWLRAPQAVVASIAGGGAPQFALGGSVSGASQLTLEAYHGPYALTSGSIDPAVDPAPWYADAASFMTTQAPGILAALGAAPGGIARQAGFSILPGIEVQAPGDLHLAGDWDLSGTRFGDGTVPGVLTVRSGGSFYVDHSITDGFLAGSIAGPGARSWSYRLAAGANLASTNPLAVFGTTELGGLGVDAGSILLAPGTSSGGRTSVSTPTLIRTGTGSIDLAAAGDLRLGNQLSVIYTAGTQGPANYAGIRDGSYNLAQGGGSITVDVGRNVVGAPSGELFGDWLWRSGRSPPTRGGFQPTAWGVNYDSFQQGIGVLGGGDLSVRAGGNISDLGANVPSIGVPAGSAASATTVEENAGTLSITAGGDILGGKFLDMAGAASIVAGGGVLTGTPQDVFGSAPTGLNLIVGLGSGQFAVTSRTNLSFETGIVPTLLPPAYTQLAAGRVPAAAFFSTFTDASQLTLASIGGSVQITNRVGDVQNSASNFITATGISRFGSYELEVLPPTMSAVAFGGDVIGQSSFTLWPGAHGNLDLLAGGSVHLTDAAIVVSDADPSLLPGPNSVSLPASTADNVLAPLAPSSLAEESEPGLHAAQPVHGGAYAANGLPDTVPARIVALTGDVVQDSLTAGQNFFVHLPKSIYVSAGRDVVNPQFAVQQLFAGDASSISAGRDITYPFSRDPLGALLANTSTVAVAGPGHLEVLAGRNVNLGTSSGITSIGNVYNPALPQTGANLSVLAGIDAAPNYAGFIGSYLARTSTYGTSYDAELEAYVGTVTGLAPNGRAQALALFEALPIAQQVPLVEQVFFDEIRASGRAAAAAGPTHDDYRRGFAALESLFPGSSRNRGKGDDVPWSGDILLYFSRVYTLAGGDIDLLAPGGQVNAGLAVAPSSFGVTKGAADLGLVAQSTGSDSILSYGDVQVNQSRVFAADGGNILMWSTYGNIDAGRGSKTAISAPPPVVTIDPKSGAVKVSFPAALTGSGIQTLASSPGVVPGDVDLFAPNGVVNANDAGIVAGNLTIAATAVLGASNISVSGSAVGLPPPAIALGALTASASSSSSAAGGTGASSVAESGASKASQTPQAAAALSWLEVFVLGLGEDQCKPEDLECLKRQKQ